MSAKCSKCGLRIFGVDGQCHGTQLPGGSWVCDDDCELGLGLKPAQPLQQNGRETMIVHVQVTMRPIRYFGTTKEAVLEAASVEIEPEFLPCLDVGKLAENLAARAFGEYLAVQEAQALAEEEQRLWETDEQIPA